MISIFPWQYICILYSVPRYRNFFSCPESAFCREPLLLGFNLLLRTLNFFVFSYSSGFFHNDPSLKRWSRLSCRIFHLLDVWLLPMDHLVCSYIPCISNKLFVRCKGLIDSSYTFLPGIHHRWYCILHATSHQEIRHQIDAQGGLFKT